MITLNNKKLALNDSEFNDSLFTKCGTCVGYYKVNKKSITLLDHQKNKIGVIQNHVLASARKLDNGKWFYSYMNPTIIGDYDYSQQNKEVIEITEMFGLPVKY